MAGYVTPSLKAYGKKVQTKLTKAQRSGQRDFRRYYGGSKTFGRWNPNKQNEQLGVIPSEQLGRMEYKDLLKTLKIFNAEANRRLETATTRLNKGYDIGNIEEYRVGSRYSHIVEKKDGSYGFKAFIFEKDRSKGNLVKQIEERQRFLSKYGSTTLGLKARLDAKDEGLRTLLESAGINTSNITKGQAKELGQIVEKLRKDKKKLGATRGEAGLVVGTNEVIQEMYELYYKTDYNDLDYEDIVDKINENIETKRLETERETQLMAAALNKPRRID